MRYLVTQTDLPSFFTDVFQYENNFVPCVGMIVYDLIELKYIDDYEQWIEVEVDFMY